MVEGARCKLGTRETTQIHHLIGAGRVTDCFRGSDGAPCWGWIPACAGMTEVGDLGRPSPLTTPAPSPSIERMSSTAQVQQGQQAPPVHPPGEHPLAQLVHDNTNQGEMIVHFLIDAMRGRIDGRQHAPSPGQLFDVHSRPHNLRYRNIAA